MEYRELRYDVRNRVATITFNRPERMNAWTDILEEELREATGQAVGDPQVGAIILTGAGRAFCAGADMRKLQAVTGGGTSDAANKPIRGDKYAYLLDIPKPMIAAINGAAAGVGLCLALHCDLRFIADGAVVTTSYARRGFVAEYGVAWLLRNQIGPMNAAEILISGRKVPANEAAAMGLAILLPAETFLQRVTAWAEEVGASCSPRSIAVMKQQLRAAQNQTLADAYKLAEVEMISARSSEDFREGVAHFVEKRPPRFTGK